VSVSIATHESDLLAPENDAKDPSEGIRTDSSSGAGRVEPSTGPERSTDLDIELAIQTIASRILAVALLERAQEAESIAT
jgi:hypothetical protein